MQVGTKAQVLAYLGALTQQAAFDGDGNAEAMLKGLMLDVESTKPDSAFELRSTFESGEEQEARRIGNSAPAEPLPPETVPAPEEIPSDKPVAEVPVEGTPAETAELTDAAHEKSQDDRIAALEKELEGAKADKALPGIAETFAPKTGE